MLNIPFSTPQSTVMLAGQCDSICLTEQGVSNAVNVKITLGDVLIFSASLMSDNKGEIKIYGLQELINAYFLQGVNYETATFEGKYIMELIISTQKTKSNTVTTYTLYVLPSMLSMSSGLALDSKIQMGALTQWRSHRLTTYGSMEYVTFLSTGTPSVKLSVSYLNKGGYETQKAMMLTTDNGMLSLIEEHTEAGVPSVYRCAWQWALTGLIDGLQIESGEFTARLTVSGAAFMEIEDEDGTKALMGTAYEYAYKYEAVPMPYGAREVQYLNSFLCPETLTFEHLTIKADADYTPVTVQGTRRNIQIENDTETEMLSHPLDASNIGGSADIIFSRALAWTTPQGAGEALIQTGCTYEVESGLPALQRLKMTVKGAHTLPPMTETERIFDEKHAAQFN